MVVNWSILRRKRWYNLALYQEHLFFIFQWNGEYSYFATEKGSFSVPEKGTHLTQHQAIDRLSVLERNHQHIYLFYDLSFLLPSLLPIICQLLVRYLTRWMDNSVCQVSGCGHQRLRIWFPTVHPKRTSHQATCPRTLQNRTLTVRRVSKHYNCVI